MLIDVLGPPEFEQWDNCTMQHIQDQIDKSSVRRAFYFDRMRVGEIAKYELKPEEMTDTSSAFHGYSKVMPILPSSVENNRVMVPSKEVALVGKDTKGVYLEPDAETMQMVVDHFVRQEWLIMLTLLDATATRREIDATFGSGDFCNRAFMSLELFPEHGGCDEIVGFVVIHPADEYLLPKDYCDRHKGKDYLWTAEVLKTDQMMPGNMLILPRQDRCGAIAERQGMTGIGASTYLKSLRATAGKWGASDTSYAEMEVLYIDCCYSIFFGNQARWVTSTSNRRAPKLKGSDYSKCVCKD